MLKFRTVINGVNCHIRDLDTGVIAHMSFYVNAFVEAQSPEEAELAAIALLRNSPKLREVILNPADDPPRLFLEEIEQLTDWPTDCAMPLGGFVFYNEEIEETR